ncbi:TetR/AcrR family transcriptional regulator [Pseudomonas lopnurensis]|uniref:TetR/AcrR family transcriptional regulator n=1 Tax=Pseudomonas lopnurensis TaxID=1477517 RepID=UPI0028AAAB35|nr:TetR/AcrR family transcriptional regulator [Pseudomonas lopnurensis]
MSNARPETGKRQTMNRLLEAARVEFARKGLAGARIENIAHEAGVTKQLAYHYFRSKEGLFIAVLDVASQRIMSELIALPVKHLSPPDALRALLGHFFDQYRDDPLLGALALQGIQYHDTHPTPRNRFLELAPALIAKLDDILRRGAASGDFRPGIDARLFLATASLQTTGWFTNGYSMSTLTGLGTRSPEGMAIWRQHSAQFLLASIRAEGAADVTGQPARQRETFAR